MSRWLSAMAMFAALAALVGAQGPGTKSSPAEQARLLTRNRQLVKHTVENSLDLSDDKFDSLKRAGTCTRLAQMWANEVKQAAVANEPSRAAEMGRHLNRVVEGGVAANLRIARKQIQPDSPGEAELLRRRNDAVNVLKPLEELLRNTLRDNGNSDLAGILADISKGRRDLESVADLKK